MFIIHNQKREVDLIDPVLELQVALEGQGV